MKGFTLIEALVVIAIIAVIAVITTASFLGGASGADVNATAQEVIGSAREAQSNATAQLHDIAWGIHFENATNTAPFYAVFTGTSYASGTVQSRYVLPSDVGFVSSSLAPGAKLDITFNPISGAPSASTTIRIYSVATPSISSTVYISGVGEISLGTAAYPTQCGPCTCPAGESGTSQNVYIGDWGGRSIDVFSLAGTSECPVNVASSSPNPNGAYVSAVGVDSNGNIYAGAFGYVEKFSAGGSYLFTLASSTFDSDCNAPGVTEEITGIAFDKSNNVYVGDDTDTCILEFNSSGAYLSNINIPAGTTSDGVAVDGNGNVYVVALGDNKVQLVSATGTLITQWGSAGTGTYQFGGTGGGTATGLAIDSSGRVYVGDPANLRVEQFTATGTYLSTIALSNAAGGLETLGNMAFDSNGNLYVALGAALEVFSPTGTAITTFNDIFNWNYGVAVH